MPDIGAAKVLTTADYNYPASNPSQVDISLLPPGLYTQKQGVSVKIAGGTISTPAMYIVGCPVDYTGYRPIIVSETRGGSNDPVLRAFLMKKGSSQTYMDTWVLGRLDIINNLNSTDGYSKVLSAAQGKALKDLIDDLDARVTALEGN